MKTTFLAKFLKDIEKITDKQAKKAIAEAIENVEKASKLADISNLKKLKGHKKAYRIRVGEYRIGVFIEANTVEFVRVVLRKDIYKLFP